MTKVMFAAQKKAMHDASISAKLFQFLSKLQEDDTLLGLHIEPIHNSADERVRTGRVDQFYRAVLFKLASKGEPIYVFYGVWPHDDAIAIAKKVVMRSNPVNGVTEVFVPTAVSATSSFGSTPIAEPSHVAVPSHVTESLPPFLESVSVGVTRARLVEELGLEGSLAEAAMQATTEDQLIALGESAEVEWQGHAVTGLAAGFSIDEVMIELGFKSNEDFSEGTEVDEELTGDEMLLAGLEKPAARMQFTWLEDDEALRTAIETGDFAAWKVFLHPEQAKYVHGRWNGSFRLSGGAGTGKTVVLLHRARELNRQGNQERIVLTTFTRTLAEAMERDLVSLGSEVTIAKAVGAAGVHVAGVDQLASKVLNSATVQEREAAVLSVLGADPNSATGRTKSSAWVDAASGATLPAGLGTPSFLEAEYDSVIIPNRVTSRDQYLKTRRHGRGVRLSRVERNAVWDIVERYRSHAALRGEVDFGEACALAAEILNSRAESGQARPADHVLVDEGQDLTVARWQLLRALVAEGPNDLFVAEDSQQRIYGQRVTLGRHGIKIVGRSRRLTLNYRTTHQVLQFATGVLDSSDYLDLEEKDVDTSHFRSARSGPDPELQGFASSSDQLDRAAETIGGWIELGIVPSSIGVLVRDAYTAAQFEQGMRDRDVAVKVITKQAAISNDPQVMTMHRAKGMEFSCVLVYGASAKGLPAAYLLKDAVPQEKSDVLQRERSLFYVAATRARDHLTVLWDGAPSEFLGVSS